MSGLKLATHFKNRTRIKLSWELAKHKKKNEICCSVACHSLNILSDWRWCSAVWSYYFQEAASKITPHTRLSAGGMITGWASTGATEKLRLKLWRAAAGGRHSLFQPRTLSGSNIWRDDAGFPQRCRVPLWDRLPLAGRGWRKWTWKYRSSGPVFPQLVGCDPKVGGQIILIGRRLCCFLYMHVRLRATALAHAEQSLSLMQVEGEGGEEPCNVELEEAAAQNGIQRRQGPPPPARAALRRSSDLFEWGAALIRSDEMIPQFVP